MSIHADIERMIPPEKSAAVFRGLHQAFGTTGVEDIQTITTGLSSDLVFRIVVKESPYLMRVMTRIDERMDPARIFACMNAASSAGLTPRVRYTSVPDGISITDFVEAAPFGASQALVEVPGVLRRLHELPRFPKTFNYVTAHKFFIWRLRTAGFLQLDDVDEVFVRYEQVCGAYPKVEADMVSCHMDLKPENMLFDGQRMWLVDWQAAFVNDRYFDLAVAANFVNADEESYLERYFGRQPNEYERARFFLMRQVVHMLAAAVFLLLGSGGRALGEHSAPSSFEEFHRRVWRGEVNLADNECKVECGLVHWAELMGGVRDARFSEALGIVRGDGELLLPRENALHSTGPHK